MPSQFPAGLDGPGDLGPPFINDVAVTDQARQIDATLRTNATDALYAIEARIGITNSAVVTSLSWATMSIGGVDNLGLRFAGSSAAWPGAVGEDGIFLETVAGYPAFHRAGTPIGTFFYLTGAAAMMSLQNSYNGGATITTAAAADLAFTFTATEDFTLTHAANSRTIISGDAHTAVNGLLDVDYTHIGVTGAMAVNILTATSANNMQIGGCYVFADLDGDLADTEISYCHGAELDMSGNGPAIGLALGAGFYAINSVFSGANNYESTGLLVDNSFDWGVYSNAPLYINDAAAAILADTDPAAAAGSVTIANAGSNASLMISTYDGTIATIGAGAVARFSVRVDGGVYSFVDSASTALTIEQDGAGNLFRLRDATATADRVVVTKIGETTITADGSSTNPTLTLEHGAATEPFLSFDGTYNAVAANGNLTDENGVGAVVGPQGGVWVFYGLARCHVASGGGGLPTGDYWVPLYGPP